MATTKMFTLGVAVIGANQINQIESSSVAVGLAEALNYGSGAVSPRFAGIMAQQATVTLSTTGIKKALTACPLLTGIALTDADLYFQQIAQGATRESGAKSLRARTELGLGVVRTLAVQHGGFAMLDIELHGRSTDGIVSPLTIEKEQTMPADARLEEKFTLGPVSIAGTALTGVQSVSLSTGIALNMGASDGEVFSTFIGIMAVEPRITITTVNPEPIADVTIGQFRSAKQTTNTTSFYLRKMLHGGTRVPVATAEHIKFTVSEGLVMARTLGGSDRGAVIEEFEIVPIDDGTNATVIVNTAIAVT
jgi:hypothetical protein